MAASYSGDWPVSVFYSRLRSRHARARRADRRMASCSGEPRDGAALVRLSGADEVLELLGSAVRENVISVAEAEVVARHVIVDETFVARATRVAVPARTLQHRYVRLVSRLAGSAAELVES